MFRVLRSFPLADTRKIKGAALLISGIIGAIVFSPILDRVLTHHHAFAARVFVPIVALTWFSLIWAVRENNTGALFALFVIIGVFSISLLPVSLELGVELTRDAATSSALLWSGSNVASIMFVEGSYRAPWLRLEEKLMILRNAVESALRDSPSANPPQNMHRALIFQGAFVLAVTSSIFFLKGDQARRQQDLARANAARDMEAQVTGSSE